MKNALMISLLLLLGNGCAATKVRDNVLMPAVQMAWPAVQADLMRGLEDGQADEVLADDEFVSLVQMATDLDAALMAADFEALALIPWTTLEPWATRGVQVLIDDGTIAEGVATSFYERIVKFREALDALLGRTTIAHRDTRIEARQVARALGERDDHVRLDLGVPLRTWYPMKTTAQVREEFALMDRLRSHRFQNDLAFVEDELAAAGY